MIKIFVFSVDSNYIHHFRLSYIRVMVFFARLAQNMIILRLPFLVEGVSKKNFLVEGLLLLHLNIWLSYFTDLLRLLEQ